MRVRHPEYRAGQHLVVCDRCGFTRWSDEVRKEWTGAIVCADTCFETRHPQDFVRGRADKQKVDDPRPYPTDTFVSVTAVDYTPAAAAATYMIAQGVAPNYAQSSVALFIGDLDVRIKVALDAWTGSDQTIAAYDEGSVDPSFQCVVTSTGALTLQWSDDGLTYNRSATSTDTLSLTAGETKWLRWTLLPANGALQSEAHFYTSDDGSSWTELGSGVTGAATDLNLVGGQSFKLAGSTTEAASGKFYAAKVMSAIGSATAVIDFDPTEADVGDTTWVAATTGETWTLVQAYTTPVELR